MEPLRSRLLCRWTDWEYAARKPSSTSPSSGERVVVPQRPTCRPLRGEGEYPAQRVLNGRVRYGFPLSRANALTTAAEMIGKAASPTPNRLFSQLRSQTVRLESEIGRRRGLEQCEELGRLPERLRGDGLETVHQKAVALPDRIAP